MDLGPGGPLERRLTKLLEARLAWRALIVPWGFKDSSSKRLKEAGCRLSRLPVYQWGDHTL